MSEKSYQGHACIARKNTLLAPGILHATLLSYSMKQRQRITELCNLSSSNALSKSPRILCWEPPVLISNANA